MVAWDLIGGVGLFLLGIVIFMDSLKAVAGDVLRRGLRRVAGTPLRAFVTGLGATSVVQSAHATLVLAMGLASAGILSTAQSLAILLGANIGTTGTAWLVVVLGLHVGFGPVAVVLVAVGAFARLLSPGRIGAFGTVTAGFGLLFIGIDQLAAGMQGIDLRAWVDLPGIPAPLALLAIGLLSAILTQSSSVTVAATITAVFAGAIPMEDGAWLVIGQNLGTTSTLALASIGASPPGRRLAVGHVLVNGTTALVMIAAFVPLLKGTHALVGALGGDEAVTIAGFHTLFNVLGAVLFLPVLPRVAALLERWVPERSTHLPELDPNSAQVPGVAIDAARRATGEILSEACATITSRVEHGSVARGTRARLDAARRALWKLEEFLDRIRTDPADATTHRMHRHVVHAMERMEHILTAAEQAPFPKEALHAAALAPSRDAFLRGLRQTRAWTQDMDAVPDEALQTLRRLEEGHEEQRGRLLEEAALGATLLPDTLGRLEAQQWMTEQAHHVRRLLGLLTHVDD